MDNMIKSLNVKTLNILALTSFSEHMIIAEARLVSNLSKFGDQSVLNLLLALIPLPADL